MNTQQIILDSCQIFKSTYYKSNNEGFLNELFSWSSLLGLLFEILGGVLFLFVLFWFFSPRIKIQNILHIIILEIKTYLAIILK